MSTRNFERAFAKTKKREGLTVDYKKQLIEQIQAMENEKILKFLYELVQAFRRNWGY